MKRLFAAAFCAISVFASANDDTLSDVGLSESGGVVTVAYSLAADAIVTADFRTNGVSVGGINQWTLSGDVHRLVVADGRQKRITWNVRKDIPEAVIENVTVELKAWAESDAPDYLVADLLESSDCRIRYFPSADFIPGGIVSNVEYRMYSIPFRKIRAKGVEWTMGTDDELGRETKGGIEDSHTVCLDANYYMGVFEFTHAYGCAAGVGRIGYYNEEDIWRFTPQNRLPYDDWRKTLPPALPSADSSLGKIGGRIGLTVDFPTEAQWEFAARGGYGEGEWGDGSDIVSTGQDSNLDRIAVYKWNGNSVMCDTGTRAPNGYGLYDMNGNVAEYCQDWYQPDISALNGSLCVDGADSTKCANGAVGTNRVARGGYYAQDARYCRASNRAQYQPNQCKTEVGCRLMTYANLGEEVAPQSFVSAESIAAIDTHRGGRSEAVSGSAVSLRTRHSAETDVFGVDSLKVFGSVFTIR